MCKLGDIIVIKKYKGDDGKVINKHSFVVINDKPGFIEGLEYDFIANALSSFKSEEHRLQKLKFRENLEYIGNAIISSLPTNSKNGFIKANQLIYFDKETIDFYVLGHISDELLDELLMLILALNSKNKLINNICNLNHKSIKVDL